MGTNECTWQFHTCTSLQVAQTIGNSTMLSWYDIKTYVFI